MCIWRGASRERNQSREGSAISQDTDTPVPLSDGHPGPGQRPERRVAYSDIFAIGEFRALWLAQILSVAGDQLARVGLTLLVFDRTHSPLLAAVTFAASVVPVFAGGVILSGLADRLPRKTVMIVCDLARAALVTVMVIPGMAVAMLVALLFLVTMIGAPFSSARAALYPEILPGDRFILGTAVTLTTIQSSQVLGFALSGTVAGFFGVRVSLLADAGTFALSALITWLSVKRRPAARTPKAATASMPGRMTGIQMVFTNESLRTPMLFGLLSAFYNAPEGVAAPLAAALGGGAVAVGMILAAFALGSSAGALTFGRLISPPQRLRWMGPLATATCAVLILFALDPPLPLALAILAATGLLNCFQVAASSAFVSAAPPGQRSQAFGIAHGGMSLGQGIAITSAGAAAQHYPPFLVIAASGAIGTLAAIAVTFSGNSYR